MGPAGGPNGIARAAEKEHQTELRRIKREEQVKMRSAERIAAAEKRRQERASQQQERAAQRAEASEQKRQTRLGEIAARKAKAQAERVAKAEAKAREKFVTGTVGRGVGRVASGVAAVGKAGLAMTGIAGAGIAASSIAQASKIEDEINRMLVGGRGAGEKLAFSREDVRKQVMQTSIQTGVAGEDIASGMRTYVGKTGDVEGAVKNMQVFATVAQATGASFDEVAQAAAALSNNLGIKDVQGMADALSSLNFQGKKGSFEFRDMAALLDRITAGLRSKGVAGPGAKGAKDIGGILQIVQSATGNADVTSTAVDSMFRQMITNSGKLASGAAFGGRKVNVFKNNDPKAGLREDMGGLIADTIGASRGNASQLQKIFGDEGMRGLNPFVSAYREASGNGKNNGAGVDAVKKLVATYVETAGSYNDTQEDAKLALSSFSSQMEVLNTQLKDAVSSELFPELIKLAPQFRELVPEVAKLTKGFVDIAGWAASNPFAALGAALTASILAEVAKAQLGQLIQNSMTPAFTAAAGSALKFSLAAGAAAASVMIAMDQNDKLKKETGGKGILDIGWEWATTDKNLKQIADENLDKQAKAEAALRTSSMGAGGDTSGKPVDGTPPVTTPKTPPASGGGAVAAGGSQLSGAAKDLSSAASAMKDAASALSKSKLDRSNSPSPVKP